MFKGEGWDFRVEVLLGCDALVLEAIGLNC